MAYKFQLGAFRASGSIVVEDTFEADASTVDSLNVQNGGITNAGSIAGATSIDGSGDLTMGTITMTGFTVDADGDTALKSLLVDDDSTIGCDSDGDLLTLGDGILTVAGEVSMTTLDIGGTNVTATAAEINLIDGDTARGTTAVSSGDGFLHNDAGTMRMTSIDKIADAFAGQGLGAASGVMAVEISGALALGAGASGKVGISGSIAGAGLAYAGGVDSISGLSVNVDDTGIEINSDTLRLKDNGVTLAKMAGLARGRIIIGDSSGDPSALALGSAGQIGVSDGDDLVYRSLSGDVTMAANGAVTIANDAVDADKLASNAVVNDSVASNAAISLTKINTNVDMGGDFSIGNQADDTATFAGHLTVGGNLIVQGSTTTVDSTTINISSSFTFEGPADDHETILSCAVPGADTTLNLPTLSAGTYFIPALADAATDASAAVTAAEFALLDGASSVGTTALASGDGFLHNDAGTMKQTSIDKIADLFAGNGLSATSAVMALDYNGLSNTLTAIAQGDLFSLADADASNEVKKITFSNLEDQIFGNVSGDATIAAGGALTIANDAVESGMLNDNVISGQTELASGDAVDADEMLISDGGTLKKIGLDSLKVYMSDIAANVSTKADGDTLIVGVNYFADMSSDGEDAVTLPASPSVGQSVKVKAPSDCSSARYITINRAGSQTIDGATSIRLESPFAAVELVYVANDLWRVF